MLVRKERTASLAWLTRMSAGSPVFPPRTESYMLPELSITSRKVIPSEAPAAGLKAESSRTSR